MKQRVTMICAIVLLGVPVSMAGSRHAQLPLYGGKIENEATESANSLYQVFPLAPRLRYVYNYSNYSYYNNGTILPGQTETDTGIVVYTILDSSINSDSVVDWSVEEASAVWDSVWTPDSVSVSTTLDTVFAPLHESLTGLHEITFSGKVWDFPLEVPSSDSGADVFRYSYSPSLPITHSWFGSAGGDYPWSVVDSSFVADGKGPVYISSTAASGFSAAHGEFSQTSATLVDSPVLAVKEWRQQPESFALYQNYPNPFNPTTVIRFGVRSSRFVSLKVYNVLGQLVKTLVDKVESPGSYEVTFDAAGLASGVYFYRLTAGSVSGKVDDFMRVRKMILLK